MDKWDEKEPEKGHKLVDAAMRCVIIPDDSAQPKFVQDCVEKYEYMPDKSWKGSGTCTDNIGADKRYESWERAPTSRNTRTNLPAAQARHKWRRHIRLRKY
jgi:hypothetical protein